MNFKHMLFRAASALLLVSGLGFAGCDDADPDAFLSVTRQEIEVEYTGLTTEGEMVNFDLGTNRSWRASYVEEWIHLTHTEGDRGRVRISSPSTRTIRARTAPVSSSSKATAARAVR